MSGRYTTGSSFNAAKNANSTSAASSFRIPPGKNPEGHGHRRGQRKPNRDGERVSLDARAGDTILFGTDAGQEIQGARDVATR
jgi:hypothetical protein